MESLVDRWRNAIQQTEELKLSRVDTDKRKIDKIQTPLDTHQDIKGSISRDNKNDKEKEKNKNSRTRSNDQKKKTFSKQDRTTELKKQQTPSKKVAKKQDRLIEIYTNAILQLVEPTNPDKIRLKLRSLLEDLLLQAGIQPKQQKYLKESITSSKLNQRSYIELEHLYYQSEKQKQYLKGKIEMISKRYENVEREIERCNKMQKLIDNTIARQVQLRTELQKAKAEKQAVQVQMIEQRQIFSREVSSIRMLIDSLKGHLPVGD